MKRTATVSFATEQQIDFGCILPDLKAANTQQLFKAVAAQTAKICATSEEYLLGLLSTQERKTPSATGNGAALAAIRLRNLKRPFALFARLSSGIDMTAPDGKPVDLFFLQLSPETDGPLHLQRLSRLARMMRNTALLGKLRDCADADILNALLSDPDNFRIAA